MIRESIQVFHTLRSLLDFYGSESVSGIYPNTRRTQRRTTTRVRGSQFLFTSENKLKGNPFYRSGKRTFL